MTTNFVFTSNSNERINTPLRRVGETIERPRVFYTPKVWRMLWFIIDTCKQEVGWLGFVKKVGHNYVIYDLIIPKQTVTGTETDIDKEQMASALFELIRENKRPEDILYWGHSHVNMGVNPSGQDEKQIDELLQDSQYANMYIRGIYNKKHESRVDVYDIANNTVFQNVDNDLQIDGLKPEEKEYLTALLEQNVKPRTYTTTNVYNHGQHRGVYDNDLYGYPGVGTPANNSTKKKFEVFNSRVTNPEVLEEDTWNIIQLDSGAYYNMYGEWLDKATAEAYLVEHGDYDLINGQLYECEKALGSVELLTEKDLRKGQFYEALDGRTFMNVYAMFSHNKTLEATISRLPVITAQ